jgi:hypothetical protein
MRKILFFIAVILIFKAAPVFASDYITTQVPDAQPVGEGRLTFMFWDVYDATLFAPQGEFEEKQPFALSLTYLRELKGNKIADRSAEEIRKLGFSDEVRLATWHSQMRNIFPDVSEGVRLTGLYNAKGESIFYKNGVEVGRIKDPEFSRYFFDIWLDQKTSQPELRAALLGIR